MRTLKWIAIAAGALIILVVIGGWLFLKYGASGFSAREKPSAVETTMAHFARDVAIPSSAKSQSNPVPDTPEVLAQARAHWADHCAVCHANDGSGGTEMGRGMYPPPPDMRQKDTQQKSDGALFYIIENGIRLSGMPAWGGPGIDPQDSWKLVRFIRHLPQLTAEEKSEMEKLNPKGPEERKEEEEEDKFLKGEPTNEPKTEHHH
ncbi:MAG TPA: c-type cytochrome [Terriglobales bacterium]|nr:c-type cytochrome [Terriglobales bacterium]